MVNSSPGNFVPAEQVAIIKYLHGNNNLVDVCQPGHPLGGWMTQEMTIPISVIPNNCVYLRAPGLTDDECPGLADIIGDSVTAAQKCVAQQLSIELPEAKKAHTSRSNTPTNDAPSSTPHSLSVHPTGTRFPLQYVCDMAEGMRQLYNLRIKTELCPKFHETFVGLPYTQSNVQRHCRVFCDALALNVIDHFVAQGKTDSGKWSALITCTFICSSGSRT